MSFGAAVGQAESDRGIRLFQLVKRVNPYGKCTLFIEMNWK